MATPVVVVPSGGIPVTQTDNGTPMTVADNGYGIAVTLVDSGGIPVNIEGAGPSPLGISGTPVLTATEGEPYAGFTATASGGTPPYTYSLVGTWPTGISVGSGTGAVSGTPTQSGTFAGLSVRVTDAVLATADLTTFSLEVAAAPVPVVDSSFTGADTSAADLASYSFADIAAGAEAANRYLVVAIASRATAARTISGVTIAGIPATEIATSIFNDITTNHTVTSFYGAAVPTGTTATVVVTFSGAMLRCGVGLYRLVDLLSLTPTDTGIAGASAGNFFMETSVDVSAGGCVLSVAYVLTSTAAWHADLTENFKQVLEAENRITGASADFASAQPVTARTGLSQDGSAARLLAVALR